MNIKIHRDIEQGTDEWRAVRMGKITASIVKSLLTGTYKISKDKKITLLAYDLAAERITGRTTDGFISFDMQRGHQEEPIARELYERASGNTVEQVGFIEDGIIGFSPDGLVGDDGIIEIKSVQQKFQIKSFAENEIPPQHVVQIQTGLLVSGRQWCDFVQYSNGMPLFIKRMDRDGEIIRNILDASAYFETSIRNIIRDYERHSDGCIVADWVDYAPISDVPDMTFDD